MATDPDRLKVGAKTRTLGMVVSAGFRVLESGWAMGEKSRGTVGTGPWFAVGSAGTGTSGNGQECLTPGSGSGWECWTFGLWGAMRCARAKALGTG